MSRRRVHFAYLETVELMGRPVAYFGDTKCGARSEYVTNRHADVTCAKCRAWLIARDAS
jgi:hypothetical protein